MRTLINITLVALVALVASIATACAQQESEPERGVLEIQLISDTSLPDSAVMRTIEAPLPTIRVLGTMELPALFRVLEGESDTVTGTFVGLHPKLGGDESASDGGKDAPSEPGIQPRMGYVEISIDGELVATATTDQPLNPSFEVELDEVVEASLRGECCYEVRGRTVCD